MQRYRVSATPGQSAAQWTQLYLGLGFTSLATLLLELSLTRLFSVVFFYHFAFLAISLALFGLGAGGVFSYVVARRGGNLSAELGRLSFINGIVVVILLGTILLRSGEMTTVSLIAVYLAGSVPFFFAGTVMSLAVAEGVARIDRTYFFDLAGAAAGCLLLLPFLDLFGGPNTVIASGVIYVIAAAIWFHRAGKEKLRALSVLTGLLLATLMVVNGANHMFDIRWAKGRKLMTESFTRWNSFSRVGVYRNENGTFTIQIDADAATAIPQVDFSRPLEQYHLDGLLKSGPGLPYLLRPAAKTLIIGAGGGYDVARALAAGSKDVSAVEINPIIANRVMRGAMLKTSRGIYERPEVRVFVEDGRSFVRRSREQYQVLQATLVDTWASTAAGAFALSENNLYTTEAFADYLAHLAPDGVMAFSRWGFEPPRESLRLLSLAIDAMAPGDAAARVIAVRERPERLDEWGALDTILIAREPFTPADTARVRELASGMAMDILYLPDEEPRNAFGELLHAPEPQAFWRDYAFDVSPVTDDQPFFFYTVQPRDLWAFLTSPSVESADRKINRAVPTLFALMGLSLVATVVIMFLPRALLGTRLPKQSGVLTFLLYFLCLGAGYILVQVALIQKFVLLLGNPTYALFAIVFAMLVASGLGSYFSRGVNLRYVLAGIAVLIVVLAFAAPPLTRLAAAWPVPLKMLVTIAAVAPAAFFMGMPFPTGLRTLEEVHAPSVRWAWSLNAAASVLGSAGAIMLAIYTGLRTTMLIGGLLYLCALLIWTISTLRFKPASLER